MTNGASDHQKSCKDRKEIGKVHLHLNNFWQWKFKFRSLEIVNSTFLSNCNWQHISQSSRLLAKIPSEMSKRLSLPTLDHFCGNLKHMFQVLEQEEEAWAADSHLESHVIHQYQSQIFLRLFAKAAPAYCLFLKSFKNSADAIQRRNFPFLIDLCWRLAHVLSKSLWLMMSSDD